MAHSSSSSRTPITPFRSAQSSGSLSHGMPPGQRQTQPISPLHALAITQNRTQHRLQSADQSSQMAADAANPVSAGRSKVLSTHASHLSVQSFDSHAVVALKPQRHAKFSVEDDPVLQRFRRGRSSLSHSLQHTFSNILHPSSLAGRGSIIEGNSVVEFASIPESISSDALDDEEDMNPYTIEFINKTMEETFHEYYWDIYYADIKTFWIVSSIISTLFTVVFASLANDHNLYIAIINFLSFILPCIICLKFGTNQSMSHAKCMLLFSTTILLSVIGPIILVSQILTQTIINPESTAAFVLIMSGLLPNVRLPLKYVSMVNIVAYISFLAACLSVHKYTEPPRRVVLPLLILLVSICVNVRNGYLSEMHIRMGFMYSRRMTGENEALRKKIWSMERTGRSHEAAEQLDLVSPMETVIRTLKEISLGPYAESVKSKIESIISLISEYETLLHPNISSQLQNKEGIDDDMSNWLFYELASKEKRILDNQKSFRRTKHSIASTNFSSMSHTNKLSKGEESDVESYIMKNFPWSWDTYEIDRLSKG